MLSCEVSYYKSTFEIVIKSVNYSAEDSKLLLIYFKQNSLSVKS